MQRYVSKELIHFVGRADLSDKERYKHFKEILDSCKLGKGTIGMIGLPSTSSKKLSSNEVYTPDMVCFSDIPLADLGIHIKKYSCFGISFLKSYLLSKGATPVWYISKTSRHRDDKTYGDWYDYVFEKFKKLRDKTGKDKDKNKEIENLFEVLEWYVFPQMKFFDAGKDDSDKENYYMEREWRIGGAFEFEDINKVRRVILPPRYVEQFKKDFPDYCGQISFAEI